MTAIIPASGDHLVYRLYVEYRLADAAREQAYDEMLTRRSDYIELYDLDMDADYRNQNDAMYNLLNAIDNTDWEFWQFHNAVNQRYSNAAEAFGRAVAIPVDQLHERFGGHNKDLVTIDWAAHETEGLYQPERYTSKEQ
jgi:hypothetical protein